MITIIQAFFFFFLLKVLTSHKSFHDVYNLPVGFRTVRVEGSRFLINNVPFYFKGFGKRQDSDVSLLIVLCSICDQLTVLYPVHTKMLNMFKSG